MQQRHLANSLTIFTIKYGKPAEQPATVFFTIGSTRKFEIMVNIWDGINKALVNGNLQLPGNG